MKIFRDICIFIFLCILSVGIAFRASDEIHLPHQVVEAMNWIQNGISRSIQLVNEESKSREQRQIDPSLVVQKERRPLSNNSIGKHFQEYYCKPTARTELVQSKDKPLYKWVDDKGQSHFSDTVPVDAVEGLEQLQLASTEKLFNLKIQSDSGLPVDFRDKLDLRVRKIYHALESFLPTDLLQPVEVKLWLFSNYSRYLAFRKKHAPDITGSNQGFHSSRNNIAAAYRRTDDQLLTTSVHEAVHVLNSGIFGITPRWLNEGLAEYFEVMNVYGQAMDVKWRTELVKQIRKRPLALSTVTRANQSTWSGSLQNSLYAHSWGLVFYLLGSDTGQPVLLKYLKSSAHSPCVLMDSHAFLSKNYPGGMRILQRDFDLWLKLPQVDQHY